MPKLPEEEKPLVTNASDRKQIRRAGRRSRQAREDELEELRQLLRLPSFRKIYWRWLTFTRNFESVFHQSELVMAHRSGAQDVGHFMLAELMEADPSAFIEMMRDHNPKELG